MCVFASHGRGKIIEEVHSSFCETRRRFGHGVGASASSGVVSLFGIQGRNKKKEYHSILCHRAIPGGINLLLRGFIFQQDNVPKHKANINLNYLNRKENQGNNV